MLHTPGEPNSCNILASVSPATAQRRNGRRFTSRRCAVARENLLLLPHRGAHGGDDRVGDAFLEELVELCWREIEFDRRVFDPFDNRAF